MTVTLRRYVKSLMIEGHSDPLYVAAADVPLLVHGHMVALKRFVDFRLEDVGVAVMRLGGDQVLFRVDLDEAAWYSAPYTPVWALSRGLSTLPICLEQTEAPA